MSRVSSCAARLVFTALMLPAVASIAFAGKNVGSVNFTLGGRRVAAEWNTSGPSTGASGDTLSTQRAQPALGVELTWGRSGWPALVALDVLHSYDDGIQQYAGNPLFGLPTTDVRRRFNTLEIGLGARRAVEIKGISAYLGAGAEWARGSFVAQMDTSAGGLDGAPGPAISHRHSTIGTWVGGGLYRRLGPRLQLGLTARFSQAKHSFPERGEVRGEVGGFRFVDSPTSPKVQLGGRHVGLIVGWSFPSRP